MLVPENARIVVNGIVRSHHDGTSCYNLFFFFFQAEDGIRDLTVTGVQTCALPIFVPADSPARSVAELVALARREPGRLSFASSGAGSSTHMSGELFKSLTHTDIQIGRASCRERV